jgi:hypothetical protein
VARYDRTIPPGGEGKITLELKTKGYQGNVHKTARVTSNDPKRSQITIGIKGKIWVPISMTPRYGKLKGVLGDTIETLVTLRAEKEAPLEIALASVTISEKIAVELVEVEKGRSYQVKIKNKVDEQTNYNGQVKLSTNYPETPELSIRVTGNIRPVLEVRPKVVDLGKVSQERIHEFNKAVTPFRRSVTIILNKGNNLQIEKLESEKSLFTAAVKTLRAGMMVQILIEPNFKKLKKGKNEDRLRVYTNQKGREVLEIPLQFEITVSDSPRFTMSVVFSEIWRFIRGGKLKVKRP